MRRKFAVTRQGRLTAIAIAAVLGTWIATANVPAGADCGPNCSNPGCCWQGIDGGDCYGVCKPGQCFPNNNGGHGCGGENNGCINNTVPVGNKCVPCPAGQEASHNQCVCSSDSTKCNGKCVDTDTDMNNCGGCGNRCLPLGGHVCDDGKCTCPPGAPTECDGKCVNTGIDQGHCGGCGYSCRKGRCLNGACVQENEPTPPQNSGGGNGSGGKGGGGTGGGVHYPPTQFICNKPLTVCDGKCTNTNSDLNNCGVCGRSCNAGYLCIGSRCRLLSPKAPWRGGAH
jgi:hypothetical protein